MNLVIEVYKLTEEYPKIESFGLIQHTRKTAVSIPSNIAEGKKKLTKKEYRHFLIISYASGAELETQIEIAKRLPFGKSLNFVKVDNLLNEIMRMLNKMTNSKSKEINNK